MQIDLDDASFTDSGIAVQRTCIDPVTIGRMHQALRWCRDHPSEHHAVLGDRGGSRLDSDLFRWRDVAAIGDVARSPRLVAAAARLLGTDVLLLEDQWFWADAGAASGSPWHQDAPYYEIDSPFITCWLALDRVDEAHSLRLVPGSHADGTDLAPVAFDATGATLDQPADTAASGRTAITASGRDHLEARSTGYELAPGDAIWFDSRVVHGLPHPSPGVARRLSVRYTPVTARRRSQEGPVAPFWSILPHGVGDGERLDTSPWFPPLPTPDRTEEQTT